eukprot:2513422-Rhodomonas_salina.2
MVRNATVSWPVTMRLYGAAVVRTCTVLRTRVRASTDESAWSYSLNGANRILRGPKILKMVRVEEGGEGEGGAGGGGGEGGAGEGGTDRDVDGGRRREEEESGKGLQGRREEPKKESREGRAR